MTRTTYRIVVTLWSLALLAIAIGIGLVLESKLLAVLGVLIAVPFVYSVVFPNQDVAAAYAKAKSSQEDPFERSMFQYDGLWGDD